MPKTKRMGKRRGRGRRPKGYGIISKSTASKVYALTKRVNNIASMLNVEKKVFDGSATGATAGNAGANAVWLSGITTGTAYNQRTGMVVKASNLYISFKCQLGAAENLSRLRFIVFRNLKLNQGALPVTGDIMQSVAVCDSPFNLDNVGDFQVLGDATIQLDSQSNQLVTRKMYIPLSQHIRWDTSGDAIGDTESGHIFFAYLGDTYVTNPPIFDYTFRLRYIDN